MQSDRRELQLNAALTRAGRNPPRESFDMRAELEALLRATSAPLGGQSAYPAHKAA